MTDPAPSNQQLLPRPLWLIAGLWLLYLSPAFWGVYVSDRPEAIKVVGYVLGVAFAALFARSLVVVWQERSGGSSPGRVARFGAFGALAGLSGAIIWIGGQATMVTLLYLAQVAVLLLTGGLMWGAVAIVMLTGVLLAELVPGWVGSLWLAVAVPAAALALWGMLRILDQNRRLENANAEMARLAVERERLRMARDLHDIVGHSLTTVAVKAELARRLIGRDDERATVELADVEGLTREALRDIRATVAGYRNVTLAPELVSARSVLAAAGIAAVLPQAVDDVPGQWRQLFGWVVREGVTNVVRHSGARHCSITVSPTTIEISDDGANAGDVRADADHSQGLRGLLERVEAAGGVMTAGRRPDGSGWVLRVAVPE